MASRLLARSRPGSRRVRTVPAAVWALLAAHLGLLVVATMLFPTYRAPDESAHVDLVRTLREQRGYPEAEPAMISRQVVDSYPLVGHEPTGPGEAPPLAAADAAPRSARPPFAAIAPDAPSTRPQHLTQHPPAYYALGAGVLAAVEAVVPGAESWGFDRTVGLLRLLSAALAAPLPLLVFLAARTLAAGPSPSGRRGRQTGATVAAAAAAVPLGVPMLTHIGAAVNNDALLILLGAVAAVPLAAAATGDRGVGTAAAIGVAGGLALLTKGFALSLPLWVAAAYAAGAAAGLPRRLALLRGGLALAVAAAIGGWWWVRNLVVHGVLQPTGMPVGEADAGFTPQPLAWLGFFLRRLVRRFWFEPDTLPDPAPPLAELASLAVVVGIVAALVLAGRHGLRRAALGALLAPAAGLAAIVLAGAWGLYADSGIPLGIHGRYLYAGFAGIAVAAAAGWAALTGRRAALLPALVVAAGALLQLTAAWFALTQYWGSANAGLFERIAAVAAWSPWPPALLALAALAAVAGWAGALAALTRGVLRQRAAH